MTPTRSKALDEYDRKYREQLARAIEVHARLPSGEVGVYAESGVLSGITLVVVYQPWPYDGNSWANFSRREHDLPVSFEDRVSALGDGIRQQVDINAARRLAEALE